MYVPSPKQFQIPTPDSLLLSDTNDFQVYMIVIGLKRNSFEEQQLSVKLKMKRKEKTLILRNYF